MLTQEEDLEIHALRKQGWSISAIARHVGHDRKTVRAYLTGAREAGVRAAVVEDAFDRFEPYVRQRLGDDHGLWASTLFDEVTALGYGQSYPTFTRKIRDRDLRPRCEACDGVKGRATTDIEHPPGEEIQWDWDELGACPWEPGVDVFLLVGSLAHSSKTRGWLTYSMDQAHLIEGIDRVLRRLGGTAKTWRVDRMATVINPVTGKLQPSFAPVAKHYGVKVVPCPPRRGNRKGVVEKNIHFVTQRWWRTLAASTLADAQVDLDRWSQTIGDRRRRGQDTVGQAAETERLLELPAMPFPAVTEDTRIVAANALVAVDGNRYSVPPEHVGQEVTVRRRLGDPRLEVVSPAGRVIATHQTASRGQGRVVRLPEHTKALENVVLAAFSSDRPCKPKENRPPSQAALAIAAEITGGTAGSGPVIDLTVYQRHIDRVNGSDGA
ncbi:MAG: IS21 family transposase [Actinobacteria bacterium]|nr:IS21 family transposase [Actinomycetota bacterium]MBU1493003.1 IS21 family transposase [Actinomycetota bacterium]